MSEEKNENKNELKISEKEKTNVEEFVSKYNITETIENALNDAFTQNANPYEFLSNYFLKRLNTKSDNLIEKLVGREILDSRGNPTVECDVYVNGKRVGRGSAPSGASTGSNEAHELRDGDKLRYLGKGVLIAVKNISGPLSEALSGKSVEKLSECDNALCKADGTELKKTYGGNAITACSFAIAIAGANLAKEELFQYLARQFNKEKKKKILITNTISKYFKWRKTCRR